MIKFTHCRRCNRRLKSPDSIKEGIGRTCAKKRKKIEGQAAFDFEDKNDVLTNDEKGKDGILYE